MHTDLQQASHFAVCGKLSTLLVDAAAAFFGPPWSRNLEKIPIFFLERKFGVCANKSRLASNTASVGKHRRRLLWYWRASTRAAFGSFRAAEAAPEWRASGERFCLFLLCLILRLRLVPCSRSLPSRKTSQTRVHLHAPAASSVCPASEFQRLLNLLLLLLRGPTYPLCAACLSCGSRLGWPILGTRDSSGFHILQPPRRTRRDKFLAGRATLRSSVRTKL